MRIPLSWLNDYIPVPDDEQESVADALTMAGLEVEETLQTPFGDVWYTKITPNRGDWASVYGTARELAAIYPNKKLKPPFAKPEGVASPSEPGEVKIRIDDSANCHRFRATVIAGVKIGPTPQWIQDRLTAALGDRYRMINNVADITNYVMLELGQPLHAFDLDTIPNGEIVVRQALPGEKLVTLDGTEHELPLGTLCICDNERAISIAGIMGGKDTEITAGTTNVLLETAHFDPFCVRRTAKKVVRSEASYRFERYVDPNLVALAGDRAAQLIVEHCGGELVGVSEAIAQPIPKRRFLARLDRVRALLGVDVDRDAAIAALTRLGLEVEQSAGALDCLIPTWRPDLTIEDDIAEEVGRIALGYAHIPEKIAWQIGQRGQDSPRAAFIMRLKNALVAQGLQEVITHSLVADGGPGALLLRNPMAPEYSQLRTSLVPGHIAIAQRAVREGIRDIAIFEVASVYIGSPQVPSGCGGGGDLTEPLRVSGLVAGSGNPNLWAIKGESYPADFYFAKGIVESLLATLGITAEYVTDTSPFTHPYRTASVLVNGQNIGMVGECSTAVVEANDLPKRTCVFGLDGEALAALAQETKVGFSALPEFASATRDVAPVFSRDMPFDKIEQVARQSAGSLLESLRLADVFEDASKLGEGKRSLTLRFTLRAPDRTLTGEEIDATLIGIRKALTGIGAERL
ncbi:phenylalanine--tRNA ligase subunit beta [Armatimonas sp.]|uniref:phenylalanine--tRNA ligase subunit beta n=1 Tax=Armatimonas sp. TaxID=1872638 RepID=UPI00374D8B1F